MKPANHPLSISIIGTRGVPPRYGGFETFAAELSSRLVSRGHRVTVYCRSSLYPDDRSRNWNGVERVLLPAVGHKYLETVSHAFLSSWHAVARSFDVALVCNAANAFVLPLLRAARIPVAINVDGIERKRKKWNLAGRAIYHAGESMSVTFADRVVADARVIADYYRQNFGIEPEFIPYGSELVKEEDSTVLGRLGLRPRRYVLYVSRFEKENNPEAVIRSYAMVRTDVPLVMVGGAPYSGMEQSLRAIADERVVFPGAIYGQDYRTLQRNALVYVQATEVGGTHPALIEAMGSGGAVLANRSPENVEVGRDAVQYFDISEMHDLTTVLQTVLDGPQSLDVYRARARSRAEEFYSWPAVTDRYESLFRSLVDRVNRPE